jgi:hypothetical protein
MTTSYMGYIYLSCSRIAGTRASARVRVRAWLTVRLFMDGFSSNLGWTYYAPEQVARDTYFSYSRTARTRASARVQARAWFNSQLSLDGFSSNSMRTHYTWPHFTWDTYLSCSITACMRACASVCVRARVWLSARLSLNGFSSNLVGT